MTNNIKLKIHRFEFTTSPTIGKIVGFLVSDLNSSNITYIETFIENEEIKDLSDIDICNLAYKKLENRITEISENYTNIPILIGSEFVP